MKKLTSALPSNPLAQFARRRIRATTKRSLRVTASVLMLFVFVTCIPFVHAQDLTQVNIQDDWKRPNYEGQVEYRAWVQIPENWEGRDLFVFLEAADDARSLSWNGEPVATLGTFPPSYRSGLGETNRFPVPSQSVSVGQWNELTLRVFRRASRDNFNVAAPVLFADDEAIRLSGQWWRKVDRFETDWQPSNDQLDVARFVQVEPADRVAATMQRLGDEQGPRSPQATMQSMSTPDGLSLQLVLGEPTIGQPLSLKFDDRGRLWVVEYLQYPNPAGLTMVSRDKYLRTVYDKVPPAPPDHFEGADRISIHEDQDRDGTFETHRVFVDGLNMVSSFAIGNGGVYILNPPYLLFYPDQNRDDEPDGPPEVLLEGFGLEDSHSITNSLRWGPDGWLYATQGSTVTGNVREYGSDEEPVHTMGQLVWRYHPPTREYEVFAEGGGNAFGLELDSAGRFYSGHNGGDTRGFHYVQGGYFQKSFGKHGALSNPFAFGYFSWMKHHSAQRFSHTFVIDEGGLFEEPFRGRLFGVEPLQSRVVMSDVSIDGSTFQTRDVGHALTSEDVWCRPVDIQSGPDGALYVADFYEQRIDHSSHYQGRVHKESGRVYRIAPTGAREALPEFDLWQMSDADVTAMLAHENRWFRQTALQTIADREIGTLDSWVARLVECNDSHAVNYLWAANLLGNLEDEHWLAAMDHPDPIVRVWAVRLACDDRTVSVGLLERLVELARSDDSVYVRSQLASSAIRLAENIEMSELTQIGASMEIIKQLSMRSEDLNDPHLPLLLWWAIERQAESNRDAIVSLVADSVWRTQPLAQSELLPRIMRRYASTGGLTDLETCGQLLVAVDDNLSAEALLQGFDAAFENRLLTNLPQSLAQGLIEHRGDSIELRLQLGDRSELPALHDRLLDGDEPAEKKLVWINILGMLGDARSLEPLLQLAEEVESSDLRIAAIHALRQFEDASVAERLLRDFSGLGATERQAVESLLATRAIWTERLLAEIANGNIESDRISAQTVDRISLHVDEGIQKQFVAIWGEPIGWDRDELERRIDGYLAMIGEASGNPYNGRQLFAEHCGRCHRLFQTGGDIGPDLTPYDRQDIRRMLANVVHPSQEIREGYETQLILTIDGQTISGFIADEDPRQVVIRQADGQTISIETDEIEDSMVIPKSVMPDDLLQELSEAQVRDLFAYLRSTQPLPN